MIVIYTRVSSESQSTGSQIPDLERWVSAQPVGEPIEWFTDTFTGTSMKRPGWEAVEKAIENGIVSKIVVWNLDRLGRAPAPMLNLFDMLKSRKINLISLKQGFDLSTPAGMLMAGVVAMFAAFERENSRERQRAGIEAAKLKGKYTGRRPGTTKASVIRAKNLKDRGRSYGEIGKILGISKDTAWRYVQTATVLLEELECKTVSDSSDPVSITNCDSE